MTERCFVDSYLRQDRHVAGPVVKRADFTINEEDVGTCRSLLDATHDSIGGRPQRLDECRMNDQLSAYAWRCETRTVFRLVEGRCSVSGDRWVGTPPTFVTHRGIAGYLSSV